MVRRFAPAALRAIEEEKYLRVRAGPEHRFTGVWVVVAERRVLVRSWNVKPGGWYDAFVSARSGAILLGGREVPVRATRVRGARILARMDDAYARKYTTKANAKYVEGFREPRRMAATLELLPG